MKSEPPLPVFDTSCCNISVYLKPSSGIMMIMMVIMNIDDRLVLRFHLDLSPQEPDQRTRQGRPHWPGPQGCSRS